MAQNWFYKAKGKEFGPVSSGELKQKVEEGVVILTTSLRREGDEAWSEARLVKGLFPPAIAAAAAKAAHAREAAEKKAAEQKAAATEQEEEEIETQAEAEVTVEEEFGESMPLAPEDEDPTTLPPLAPEPEAAEKEPETDTQPVAKRKLPPKLLAIVGGGAAAVLVVGVLAWWFLLSGGEETLDPSPGPAAQLSEVEQQLNTVTRHLAEEEFEQAQQALAGVKEEGLSPAEQSRADSLGAEIQQGLDQAAATETLGQIELQIGKKEVEAILASIAAYEENPQASEEEKARLALLREELIRATSTEAAQTQMAQMSDEELGEFNAHEWEPETPYETALAAELAASTMAVAVSEEQARRRQALLAAAEAEAAASRLSHAEYLAFRDEYDDYMLRIAALRIGDLEGEPTAERWTDLAGLPQLVQGNLEFSQSFAGRKEILGIAASCREYLAERLETVEEKQAALEQLREQVLASSEAYPAGSLAQSVFAQLAEALATQVQGMAAEGELLAKAQEEIEFEYALADRRQAAEFVEQFVGGMLELRTGLPQARAPQGVAAVDVWLLADSDYPTEWEEDYQTQFMTANATAMEGFLARQEELLENVEGLLGHWRLQTEASEEGLGLDLYIQEVDLAVYESPPVGATWQTAALLRPGASYLVLEAPSGGAVITRPNLSQVAALVPGGEEPTGFPFAYLASGEEEGTHLLRAVHVTAMRTVAPQGKLEGWCVVDERGRLYIVTGNRFSWTSPPLLTALAAPASGEGLRAANCTRHNGLQLVDGMLSFAEPRSWSTEPGISVLAGSYDYLGEERPSWATEFGPPLERPVAEHPFVNPAWRNATAPVEVEEEDAAGEHAEPETPEDE